MNRRIRQAFQESFALKVLAALVPVIVVSLIIYTAIGAMREGDKVKTGLIERGELYAGLLSHGAVVGIFAENTALLKDAAAGILRQRDVLSVSMYNADGKLLYEGSVTVPGKSPYQAPGKGTEQREGAMTQEIVETADAFEFIKHVSSKSLPGTDESIYLDDAGQRQAGQVIGFVRIVLSRDSYRKEIISLVARNAVMMLVFIVSIGAIVWFAVKNVMRPLEQLTGNVKALGEGLHVNAVPVETTDEVGKLASAFNAMVVARGMAEGSLRESEERYRRLVELSPDAVYVQQAEKIVFINAAGAKLMGASSAQQLVGSQATKFVHEHDRELVRKSFLHVAKEGTTVPFLLVRYVRPDCVVVDAEMTVAPFPFKGDGAVLIIARDVTEHKGMEEKIRIYQNELRAAELERDSLESRIEERERHFIAADLHDYVAQNLVVSNFKLGGLKKYLSGPDAVRYLEEIREILGQTLQYTRSLTVELSPPVLTEIGLTAAVEALAEQFQKTHEIRVSVEHDGRSCRISEDARYLLFRSVRELLMNVVKHSNASHVMISIAAQEPGAEIQVMVADDGDGFDAAAVVGKDGGFGLFTIRERLRRIKGSFVIETGPGEGTKVIMTAPLVRSALAAGEGKP